MANNRMTFICNVCLPEGENYDYERWRKSVFYIAKRYYGAWYTNEYPEYPKYLNEFFDEHKHEELDPQGVENPVRLNYESERPIPPNNKETI